MLGGYALPAGAKVIMSIYSLHHSEAAWPQPETFEPARFLPEHPEHPRYRQAPCASALTPQVQAGPVRLGPYTPWLRNHNDRTGCQVGEDPGL